MTRKCENDRDPYLLFKVISLISHAIAMLGNGKLLANIRGEAVYRISDRLAIIDRTIKEYVMVPYNVTEVHIGISEVPSLFASAAQHLSSGIRDGPNRSYNVAGLSSTLAKSVW